MKTRTPVARASSGLGSLTPIEVLDHGSVPASVRDFDIE